jgi:hypothetical protein
MTKEELAQLESDQRYWQELATLLGWQLHGFTNKSHASFITKKSMGQWVTLPLSGAQRDDIVNAIRGAQ